MTFECPNAPEPALLALAARRPLVPREASSVGADVCVEAVDAAEPVHFVEAHLAGLAGDFTAVHAVDRVVRLHGRGRHDAAIARVGRAAGGYVDARRVRRARGG